MLAIPVLLLLSLLSGLEGFQLYIGLEIPVGALTAFGLSVFVEGDIVQRFLIRSKIWTPVFAGNIITYILLIAITASSYVPPDGRRAAWMSRAKGTLRSIGSSQLAYQQTNNGNFFGSFEALKDTLYIAEGYTTSNMIENYSLYWMVNNIPTVPSEQYPEGLISTFTIIAFPRDTRENYLKTFAVTTDQQVREYSPWHKSRFDSIATWDPIL
jgi:hypothetical protein